MTEVVSLICRNNNFSLVDKVGEGQFKTSYLVQRDDDKYALKIFKQNKVSRRSQREIKAIIECDHKNICKILNYNSVKYKDTEYLYIIEEYLSGGTLKDYIETNGYLTKSEIITIGYDLILAIKHISEKGFVHRDIKPENIMFRTEEGSPVIVDFGLVRDLNRFSLTNTQQYHGPGTPYYAAPEQLNNEKTLIDWRTDQFALGVLLSKAFFGIHPYSKKVNEAVENVMNRSDLNPDFIWKVENKDIYPLKKMVQPWPVDRYIRPDSLLEAWEKL